MLNSVQSTDEMIKLWSNDDHRDESNAFDLREREVGDYHISLSAFMGLLRQYKSFQYFEAAYEMLLEIQNSHPKANLTIDDVRYWAEEYKHLVEDYDYSDSHARAEITECFSFDLEEGDE